MKLHLALFSTAILTTISHAAEDWRPLFTKDLSDWEVFIGVPHKSISIPGLAPFTSEDCISGEPLGLGKDPLGVFQMIEEDGKPVLHVSGQIYGGLSTKEEFSNYHLRWQFRWGVKQWEPRLKTKRDSGMLIHCSPPHGAFWNVWMSSLECQIQEGDCGDFIPLAGTAADLRVKPFEKGKRPVFDQDGTLTTGIGYASHGPSQEKPNGEWNTMEIYAFGDTAVYIVNGTPNMVLFHTRHRTGPDTEWTPLTGGRLQLQSEAAEVFYRDLEIQPITGFPESLKNLTTVPEGAPAVAPNASVDPVFDETEGIIAVEAEHFYKQTLTDKRAWYVTSSKGEPEVKPDPDPSHAADASGGAYIEILPDTRATHGDKLIQGENFSPEPGKLAVAHYKVNIRTAGRYYVWIRACSTGSEDNGVHVGLDGEWPESGQRWQTTQKKVWSWDCRQRTEAQHGGVPMQLFLDIEKPGEHEIQFSMREDGFEMDKFILASSREFKPEDNGPVGKLKPGEIPAAF